MKTLIAVRGVANRGKSDSIKKAYGLLKHAYPNATIDERVVLTDITVVITIDGVKVGIESQGDPNSRLAASMIVFVDIGCKVIICATRSRGQTVEHVQALASEYQINWLAKSNVDPEGGLDAANRQTAREILAFVQLAIDA